MDLSLVKPPTDNLYKFMALSGLLVLILSVVLASWYHHQLSLLWWEVIDDAVVRSDEIHREWQSLLPTRAATEPSDPEYLPRDYREARSREARLRKTTVQYMERHLGWIVFGGWLGGVLGFAFAFVGFWLWYFRLQRYVDRKVKVEAEEGTPKSAPSP